jgi:hypothetical protein
MGLALQTLFVGAVCAMISAHIMLIHENKRGVKKLNVHTHAADGSVNGISGWY